MPNGSTKPESNSDSTGRLRLRGELLRALRSFFHARGFAGVTTPTRIAAPAPEEFIDVPRSGDLFLRASPELEMKQLLAAGHEKIYQIGPCFREGEFGRLHRPEFTMLEFYQTGADYRQLLAFTREMLIFVATEIFRTTRCYYQGTEIDFAAEWEIITVAGACRKFAGTSPEAALESGEFDRIMIDKIEPALSRSRPAVLTDYPAARAALARLKPDNPAVAERWELYLGGLEIANTYSELTDPAVQKQRFREAEAVRRAAGKPPYPEPEAFYAALESGLPECAGCALGFDRLAMIFTDSTDISEVIPPEQ